MPHPRSLWRTVTLFACAIVSFPTAGHCVLAPTPLLEPFPMNDVRLLNGPEKTSMEADLKYLKSLDSDRLLLNFRRERKIAAPGEPLGGWESWDHTPYPRGAFLGHYLSACALMAASTGDMPLLRKANHIVAELYKCQLSDGYLAAFPEHIFDDLEADRPDAGHPYYIVHKMFAGLVDMYQYTGNRQALFMAKRMADYFSGRTEKLSSEQMDFMFREEFGGMSDTAYQLYSITHRARDLALAERFDQASVLGPLALQHDNLTGLHANTTIPKVLGAAHRYDLLGDPSYRTAAEYFWDRVANHRSYATGGTSDDEHWGFADKLASTLSQTDEETCTTYNMLKLTRELFCWTADPKYADFYERAYLNGIMPAQDPANGQFIYFLPMQANGVKQWGTPYGSFWCCYGTGIESFAKLGDSLYFHGPDSLYVTQYVSSTVRWPQNRFSLQQWAVYGAGLDSVFRIKSVPRHKVQILFHVPGWCMNEMTVTDGEKVYKPSWKTPGYIVINRRWHTGDRLTVHVPMHLHTVPLPDNPNIVSVKYGPFVMAGLMDPETRLSQDKKTGLIRGSSTNPSRWLVQSSHSPFVFHTSGQVIETTFMPLSSVINQTFGVYWTVQQRLAKSALKHHLL